MGGQSFFHERLVLGREAKVIKVQRPPDEELSFGNRKGG